MALELERWATMAKAHWKEHQPTRYRRLVQDGELNAEAAAAARLTDRAMQEWLEMGATREEAFQAVRQRYLFPPEEPGASKEAPDSIGQQAMVEMVRTLQGISEDED